MADDEVNSPFGRYTNPPVYGPTVSEKIPGTGSPVSPAASALVGFAKGLSGRLEKDREATNTNQRVALQYLISGGHVAPAYRGAKADFVALGMPWQVTPGGSGLNANEQSLIDSRKFTKRRIETGVGEQIAEDAAKKRIQLMEQHLAAANPYNQKEVQAAQAKAEAEALAYENSRWDMAEANPIYDQDILKEMRKRSRAARAPVGDPTAPPQAEKDFFGVS